MSLELPQESQELTPTLEEQVVLFDLISGGNSEILEGEGILRVVREHVMNGNVVGYASIGTFSSEHIRMMVNSAKRRMHQSPDEYIKLEKKKLERILDESRYRVAYREDGEVEIFGVCWNRTRTVEVGFRPKDAIGGVTVPYEGKGFSQEQVNTVIELAEELMELQQGGKLPDLKTDLQDFRRI